MIDRSRKIMQPLEGVRVLELSRFLAGPFCGLILAHLGAEVIKVELPGGEPTRKMLGPFYKEKSLWFSAFNSNKKGITLDWRSEEGKKILYNLVKKSDILIENMVPGGLAKRTGLTIEALHKLNPSVVLVSVSGYGQFGPNKNRRAHDQTVQAEAGLMALQGEPKGIPMKTGPAIGDFLAGYNAALGALAAVMRARQTGKGDHVDVALYDSIIGVLETHLTRYTRMGLVSPRIGNRSHITAPTNLFKTVDGYIMIIGADDYWIRLTKMLGKPELAEDPRFKSAKNRLANEDETEQIVKNFLNGLTTKEAVEQLEDAGIPVAPLRTLPEVAKDPQVRERKLIRRVKDSDGVSLDVPVVPINFLLTETKKYKAPPLVGEHNVEVYGELLKLSNDHIAELAERGII